MAKFKAGKALAEPRSTGHPPGTTDDNGDFTRLSGTGYADQTGDFTLSSGAAGGGITLVNKHAPDQFSFGGKGAFTIVVKNKGEMVEAGMISVSDHMPPGLTMKSGRFKAGAWACNAGEATVRGQDIACTYNKNLKHKSKAKLKLDVTVAKADRFAAKSVMVENIATAIIRYNAVINGDVDVKVERRSRRGKLAVSDMIRLTKKTKPKVNFDIGIGVGGSGGHKGSDGPKDAAGRRKP